MRSLFTHNSHSRQAGFTIIEVMIAMSIFTVIVTIGIGAVLDSITQHHVAQDRRTVMDNLNFIMEDMARNMRLGSAPSCGVPTVLDPDGYVIPHSCAKPFDPMEAHNTISFNAQDGTVFTYTISPPTAPEPNRIFKQKGTDAPQVITPPEVEMDWANSGFTVRGAEAGDGAQPTVVIRLSGTVTYKNTTSKFAIQTSVTLRALDS
jgi:prepilin-type N-terminal cleavage/methylation domain-containing protein